jgi:hypothetical protein
MGLFSALGSIFGGGTENISTSTSNVTVEVNPEIQVANIVELEPVEKLVAILADNAAMQSAVTSASLAAVIENQNRTERSAATRDKFLGQFSKDAMIAIAVIGGAAMMARAR